MDKIVEAALKKWPNVPHCYGWLARDARGDWYMRDDRIQAAGPFPQVKGSRIEHDKLLGFIERNYAADERGCWFFQNGPQRVYVELEAAPQVWRLHGEAGGHEIALAGTDGTPAHATGSFLDESGRLFVDTDRGFGIVHTLDMLQAAGEVERGRWQPEVMTFTDMPARFGYVLVPQPPG